MKQEGLGAPAQRKPDASSAAPDPFPHLPPRRHATDIRADPRFDMARRVFFETTARAVPDPTDRALAHLLSGMGRAALFSVITTLHFEQNPDIRQTWPTPGTVRSVFLPLGFTSSRGLDSILARLNAIGLVSYQRPKTDGRLRLVVPTRNMLELDLA